MAKFIKGQIPWNKGKHPEYMQGSNHPMFGTHPIVWNKGKKGIMPIPWNKGKHPEYMQGKSHPMFGKKHTPEAIEKISESGKSRVPWNKGLMGYMAGKKHYKWKGGKGTERHQEMGRLRYVEWRSFIFEKDNYTCQNCGAKGVYLMVHHKKSWAKYPKLRYELSNGITLCKNCHAKLDKFYARFYEMRILN